MSDERLDTAHEYWDQWWQQAKQRSRWNEPEPKVTSFASTLDLRGAKQVLDVGTGIGRHALAYARLGFEVHATDASAAGLEEVARSAVAEGLEIDLRRATFTDLPFEDASMDHVLAWNVIYHGDGDVVAQALRECRRVLRADSTFQFTMLSKRNRSFGIGREIRPDTFVDDESQGDKDHPHFYVDENGLARMLDEVGFETLQLDDVDQDAHSAFHWEVLARVRPPQS
jgi:2-polyprenyl-3-methyl-5-hydroxy-6-metoxy-1,4-benzoquinol methylase